MKKVLSLKTLVLAAAAGAMLLASCNKSNDSVISSSDSQNVNSESVADNSISESGDLSDAVATSVTATTYGTAARTEATDISSLAAMKDPRLAGATVTIMSGANSTKDSPNGTITIDFGTGVTVNGVTRVGKIIILYSGKKGVAGSYRSVGYSGYSRNGVAFDDAMTFTNTYVTDSTVFHHVLANGKLTFTSDNTTLTRTADHYSTIDYTNKTVTLSMTPSTSVAAAGTTRGGKSYSMVIDSPLVYKASCLDSKVIIPVSGSKTVTVDSKLNYTVDYGDGTCDNTLTITILGKTVTVTASSDGH